MICVFMHCLCQHNFLIRQLLKWPQLEELLNPEAGFLVREGLTLCVEVLECCPWCAPGHLSWFCSLAALHCHREVLQLQEHI